MINATSTNAHPGRAAAAASTAADRPRATSHAQPAVVRATECQADKKGCGVCAKDEGALH